ncbi:MAG: isocitrate/isopropylmalate dehydrogenase family protein [Solirubrobacterales bacterium]
MTTAELHTVTVVPGDGIGPEVVEAACRVIDASGARIEWEVQEAGAAALERHGNPLPEQVAESVRRRGVALKGPLTTSADRAYGSPNVALREALDLHTTIRPCRALEGVAPPRPGVDLVVVKMNHEDLYARIGFAHDRAVSGELRELIRQTGAAELTDDTGLSIKPLSQSGARRVIGEAFAYARAHGRSRVTVVHKASLMPETDGLFLEVAREVGDGYSDVAMDDELVDTVCERLVSKPESYDVLVTPRMYGDIVSGLGAALIGGPGMAPGVNIGEQCVVFEATHGSAPRLAGRGRANPIALIRSGAMLLDHLGEREAGERVEAAVGAVVREGRTVTYDLRPPGGSASTDEVADAVIAALGSSRA